MSNYVLNLIRYCEKGILKCVAENFFMMSTEKNGNLQDKMSQVSTMSVNSCILVLFEVLF